jgi:hypothetical protein
VRNRFSVPISEALAGDVLQFSCFSFYFFALDGLDLPAHATQGEKLPAPCGKHLFLFVG